MISFVLLSLPVFAVVALGWATAKAGLASSAMIDGLGAFSFRFGVPALILRLVASEPLGQSFNPRFFAGYLASGGLMFALVLGVAHLIQRQSVAVAGARATTATVSNLGFLGLPLVLAFFGPHGAGPLAMAIICEIMILMSIGAITMATGASNSLHAGTLILRGTLYNPIVAAIGAGGLMAASGRALPAPLSTFLTFLGASAGPTALFAVGGALAAQRFSRRVASAASCVTLIKLAAYPLTVWCLLTYVLRLEPFWIGIGVLLASLPSAGSNYVLAQRYAADADQVSAGIVLSTLVSVLTVPWVGWLMVRP